MFNYVILLPSFIYNINSLIILTLLSIPSKRNFAMDFCANNVIGNPVKCVVRLVSYKTCWYIC